MITRTHMMHISLQTVISMIFQILRFFPEKSTMLFAKNYRISLFLGRGYKEYISLQIWYGVNHKVNHKAGMWLISTQRYWTEKYKKKMLLIFQCSSESDGYSDMLILQMLILMKKGFFIESSYFLHVLLLKRE